MTNEDLQQIAALIVDAEQRIVERIMTTTTANLSDLRQEMLARFNRVERRLERVENNISALLMQTAV